MQSPFIPTINGIVIRPAYIFVTPALNAQACRGIVSRRVCLCVCVLLFRATWKCCKSPASRSHQLRVQVTRDGSKHFHRKRQWPARGDVWPIRDDTVSPIGCNIFALVASEIFKYNMSVHCKFAFNRKRRRFERFYCNIREEAMKRCNNKA